MNGHLVVPCKSFCKYLDLKCSTLDIMKSKGVETDFINNFDLLLFPHD